jgi:predicted ribosome quality control (RQC) complex YloA/Tae2 family protein
MRALCSLELPALIEGLKSLEGFRINRFYDAGNGRFFLRLRKGEEKVNVQCILPYTLNITEYVPQSSEPTGFASAARKRIEDFVIDSITQLNNDRIVLISLRKGETRGAAIIELFGRGNLILVDGTMRITLAYMSHDFKDRSVRPGAVYGPPSGVPLDVLDLRTINAEIKGVRQREPDSEVLAALTRAVGIGKLYVEESLARAGIGADTKVCDIEESGFDSIAQHAAAVITECMNARSPTLYAKDGVLVDFSLCSIKRYAGLQVQKPPSFQNLLDAFYNQQVPAEAQKSHEAEELEKSLEKQRAFMSRIDAESAECTASAGLIMRNLHRINAIIDFLRQNKHATKEDAQAAAQGIRILNVNLKDKTVSIEIE